MKVKPESVLIIGTVWPEPNSSAAGTRMMQLISSLQDYNLIVHFASTASDSPFMIDLSAFGIKRIPILLNDSSFDVLISQLKPDIVIFDRFMTEEQFGWRVVENSPDSLRILDTEDLHCLRHARHHALKKGSHFELSDLFNEDIAIREIASILRCDLSLIISEYELEILRKVFHIDTRLLHYVPYMIKPAQLSYGNIDFKDRKHFVTIGNFLHEPNLDSARFLKESVWPKIRAIDKEVELHIYGSYTTQKVQQMHNPAEKFFIRGRADNQFEVLSNARVCLSPLRFGAGLKGKLVEAMMCGTPSITTPIGAEGINGDFEWPGIIAKDPQDLATSAINLYYNESEWHRAVKSGKEVLSNRFNYETHSERLNDLLQNLHSNLKKHRMQNFTAKILHHNSMSATKYLSKWIEAKNRDRSGEDATSNGEPK
jgi:glycosyltransferase involved in cell wall biosynthesis